MLQFISLEITLNCLRHIICIMFFPLYQKKGFEYMLKIANSTNKRASHLVPFARYNVGRAYFEGFGVKQSDKEAERWWLLAADDGNPKASIKAQTALGMYYCREDSLNLEKVCTCEHCRCP